MRQLLDAAGRRARNCMKTSGPAAGPNGPERRRTRPCVESLELRQLLSTITEYSVPLVGGKNGAPSQITVDPNGTLYFVEPGTTSIGSVSVTNPNPVTLTNLPTGSIPDGITLGPDGNLWFTESATGQIGSFKLTGTTPPTPTGITSNSGPAGITTADGSLWFTQIFSNQIGRLDPSTGAVTEFNLPTGSAFGGLDSKIILGPDGNLWFTEFGAIAAFNPSDPNIGTTLTLNVTKTATLPGGSNEEPFGITAGPNGTIWYTAQTQNPGPPASTTFVVGAFSTSSPSSIHETQVASATEPFGITAGPDGNMWFAVTGTATVAGTIDSINPSTYALATLPIPTNVVATPAPIGIVAAPDGNLWFSDSSGAIGVVADTQLVVTAQPSPPNVGINSPFGLTVTDEYANGVVDTAFNGSVTIRVSNNPSSGTLSGTLTVNAVNGVANFSGLKLNSAGNGYTIAASSSVTTAPPTSTTTNGFNVTSSPTPTPTSPTPTPTSPTPTPTPPPAPTIIGEQAVFIQKTKKVGNRTVKVGKPVFSGFMITFSTAMNQGTLVNAANYVMDTAVPVKKTRKSPATTKLTPVRFSVTGVTSTSVTLKPAGTPFATKAGEIVVNASTGVESAAGAFMAPPSVTLPIAKGGKSIS
jgi:streptogramin lyase